MKSTTKNWITAIIIILILIIPIVVNYVGSKSIKLISYEEFKKLKNSNSFGVYYIGDVNKDDYKNIEKSLLNAKDKFDVNIKSLNKKDLSKTEKSEFISNYENFEEEDVYVFVLDGNIVYTSKSDITNNRLIELINKYYNNIIPESEIAYKTVSTYKAYMKLVDSKKVTVAVFGRNSCSWCNKYKPVYNEVANEYKLDIYYFDSDSFDKKEYNKIMNSDLKIPAKCTDSGKDQSLSEGFGTPLTMITKKGKAIDCISGYVDKDGLIKKLTENGLIK